MKGPNRSFGAAVAAAVVMMLGAAGVASAQSGYVPLFLPENVTRGGRARTPRSSSST